MPKNFLPVCLNLHNFKILIVGGGHAALSKLKTLLKFDCAPCVIAKVSNQPIQKLAQRNKISLTLREFEKSDLAGFQVVYACTDNMALNQQIALWAKQQKMLCNISGDFKLSNFISTAIYRKNKVMVAVSTSGQSPLLAVSVRNRLKRSL